MLVFCNKVGQKSNLKMFLFIIKFLAFWHTVKGGETGLHWRAKIVYWYST